MYRHPAAPMDHDRQESHLRLLEDHLRMVRTQLRDIDRCRTEIAILGLAVLVLVLQLLLCVWCGVIRARARVRAERQRVLPLGNARTSERVKLDMVRETGAGGDEGVREVRSDEVGVAAEQDVGELVKQRVLSGRGEGTRSTSLEPRAISSGRDAVWERTRILSPGARIPSKDEALAVAVEQDTVEQSDSSENSLHDVDSAADASR